MEEKSESLCAALELRAAMIAAGDELVGGSTRERATRHAQVAAARIGRAFVEGETYVEFHRGVRRGSTR
jgi:hypothetical protein